MPILPDIALQGITKRFPGGHLALDSVSLTFRPGQLHAVVGENGAGKSTLMNILFGLHQPDTGDILVDGKRRVHRSPAVAIAGGVGMVHQHFKLVPSFTVLENIRLAARPGLRHRLRRARDIMALGERYGISVPPDTLIAALPLAVQQRVEILKALANEAALLILDEPTTILNPQEAETLYSTLRRIAADGRSVAVVTHHLDEVLTHSDQVSVLRHGRLVSTGPTAGTTRAQLIHDIIGRRGEFGHSLVTHRNRGAEALRLQAVSVPPTAASAGLQAVDLTLHHGEVLAVAGVEGNGQRELFDILAGPAPPLPAR